MFSHFSSNSLTPPNKCQNRTFESHHKMPARRRKKGELITMVNMAVYLRLWRLQASFLLWLCLGRFISKKYILLCRLEKYVYERALCGARRVILYSMPPASTVRWSLIAVVPNNLWILLTNCLHPTTASFYIFNLIFRCIASGHRINICARAYMRDVWR